MKYLLIILALSVFAFTSCHDGGRDPSEIYTKSARLEKSHKKW
jgi:hypothetical protein